jgi:hypothetical protein
MLGDGQTEYDYEHDGESNALGGCTVCFVFRFSSFRLPID